MSMEIHCKGPEELKAKLKRFTEIFPDGASQALWEQAQLVMNDSAEEVPVDTGYLRSTRYVNDPFVDAGHIKVELGYYANYAAPVHDITPPPAKSKGGRSAVHMVGKWMYLNDPMESRGPKFNQKMVSRLEQMLGGI